jgi:hypothetical protein
MIRHNSTRLCRNSARQIAAWIAMLVSSQRGAAMFNSAHPALGPKDLWASHREATMNWLALGLLLAAWNACDNRSAPDQHRRPEALRGYANVSVRAAQRIAIPER